MSVTWNPSDKNANISLSEGNLKATALNIMWKSVRATTSKSSGKWYWEITINVASTNYNILGVGTSSADINSYCGSTNYCYGYAGYDGKKFHSGSSQSYGFSFTAGDIISVALDMDNGELYFAKNGVWQNSGNPETRDNPAYTGLSGAFFPMGSPYTNTNAFTANFGATALSYSIPSGYSILEPATDACFFITGNAEMAYGTELFLSGNLDLTAIEYTLRRFLYGNAVPEATVWYFLAGIVPLLEATKQTHLQGLIDLVYKRYSFVSGIGNLTYSQRAFLSGNIAPIKIWGHPNTQSICLRLTNVVRQVM